MSQARSGREVPDVEGTPWWIECKCGNTHTLTQALKQAREATDGRLPVVIVRRDREKSMVVMELEVFKRICADVEQLRKIGGAVAETAVPMGVPLQELAGAPDRLEG